MVVLVLDLAVIAVKSTAHTINAPPMMVRNAVSSRGDRKKDKKAEVPEETTQGNHHLEVPLVVSQETSIVKETAEVPTAKVNPRANIVDPNVETAVAMVI